MLCGLLPILYYTVLWFSGYLILYRSINTTKLYCYTIPYYVTFHVATLFYGTVLFVICICFTLIQCWVRCFVILYFCIILQYVVILYYIGVHCISVRYTVLCSILLRYAIF